MNEYVLDASVLIKWFNQEREKDIGKAMRLRRNFKEGKIKIYCPDLILYEFLNALWKGKGLGPDKLQEAAKVLFALPIKFTHLNLAISLRALEIATSFNLTFYDAGYVAVAKYLGCKLISANPRCFGKIKDGSVISLSSY